MLANTFKDYLDKKSVRYEEIPHLPAYTAAETAQAAHIKGRHMAKVVIVKLDGKLAMTVLPANKHIDLDMLKKVGHSDDVEIAHEYEFSDKFEDCEVGAMPPFGELYGMDVFLADSLSHQDWVAFNCGSHSELITMDNESFLKLVRPEIIPEC